MSREEIGECLLCLRTPLEKIRETVDVLLVGHGNDTIDRVSKRAAKLIATTYEKDRPALCGRKPSGIMASAIYLAVRMENGVNISQGKVAKVLDISDVTLRTGARQIKEILDLDIPKFPGRRERYVCPFCEEVFISLADLKIHLNRKKIRPSSALKFGMFNDDGILVDEEVLERLKGRTKRRKKGRSPGKIVPEPIMLLDQDKREIDEK